LTAWHLERSADRHLSITIFEATGRLGGKLVSPTFTRAPVRYEAGAAEIYDYEGVGDDPLRSLVRSFGLPTTPIHGSAVYVGDRRIASLDDMRDAFGTQSAEDLLAFDMWSRAMTTCREFYEADADRLVDAAMRRCFRATMDSIRSSPVRSYVETLIHSDLATEPRSTTVSYGLQNYLMNDPSYMRLYRIVGGNEQLVTAIAHHLSATVRLHTTVTEIGVEQDGRLAIKPRSSPQSLTETFDVVILALPIEPLKRVQIGDPELSEAMNRHVTHHDHPAHYLRITLLLDGPTPNIPGEDDFVMTDAFGGACLYIESRRDPVSRHGVFGWLIGGEAAMKMANESDDTLISAAVEALPSWCGDSRGRVLEGRVHRWVGAVSAVPGGWHPLPLADRHRPSARHPNLYVVGDYLYDSTLNGVMDSADYVAGWVAANGDAVAPDGRNPTRK
jgi:protoporphyrinogen oxidase